MIVLLSPKASVSVDPGELVLEQWNELSCLTQIDFLLKLVAQTQWT